jgi:mRNA interferase RelE/StbE
MANYNVLLSKKAQKQLDKLSESTAKPIFEAIAGLGENPRPIGSKKLKERPGYRIRKGDYRIIYDIFDEILIVDIIAVAHRKDVYD